MGVNYIFIYIRVGVHVCIYTSNSYILTQKNIWQNLCSLRSDGRLVPFISLYPSPLIGTLFFGCL